VRCRLQVQVRFYLMYMGWLGGMVRGIGLDWTGRGLELLAARMAGPLRRKREKEKKKKDCWLVCVVGWRAGL